jgi:lipopolysaccharide/colanic/teichoic acid biosynthesis glycosyltransferase
VLWIELGENPFFVQERAIAYGTKHFNIFKFRTIRTDHSKSIICNYQTPKFLIKQIPFKLTPFAKWLRKTGLDELPQIYNVLAGKMSFVGPRPLMIADLQRIEKDYPEQHLIRKTLESKPGITGVWQLSGNRDHGVDNLLGLDLFYEENKSFKLDLKILLSTLVLVIFAQNSDGIIQRLTTIEKIFSTSQFEFLIDHGKYLKKNTSAIKSYSLKIPNDWWCISDSYAGVNFSKIKQNKFLERKIFTN